MVLHSRPLEHVIGHQAHLEHAIGHQAHLEHVIGHQAHLDHVMGCQAHLEQVLGSASTRDHFDKDMTSSVSKPFFLVKHSQFLHLSFPDFGF